MSAPAEPAQPAKARAENTPPQIRSVSIVPSEPLPGAEVQAQVSVQDPDGDVTRLRYLWTADGDAIPGGHAASLRLPDFVKGTRIEVQAVASDGVEDSPPATAHAEVANGAPTITGVRFEPAEGIRAGDAGRGRGGERRSRRRSGRVPLRVAGQRARAGAGRRRPLARHDRAEAR